MSLVASGRRNILRTFILTITTMLAFAANSLSLDCKGELKQNIDNSHHALIEKLLLPSDLQWLLREDDLSNVSVTDVSGPASP